MNIEENEFSHQEREKLEIFAERAKEEWNNSPDSLIERQSMRRDEK